MLDILNLMLFYYVYIINPLNNGWTVYYRLIIFNSRKTFLIILNKTILIYCIYLIMKFRNYVCVNVEEVISLVASKVYAKGLFETLLMLIRCQ